MKVQYKKEVFLSPLLEEVSLSPLLEEVSLSSLLRDDLVIEILLQLHFPVESVRDFKCLNKTWHAFKMDNLEGIECSYVMLCCLCRTNDLYYTYFDYTCIIINPVTGLCTTISESFPNILAQTSKGWTEMGKYHIFDSRIGNGRIIKLYPSFELKNPCLRMLSLHSKSYLTEEDSLIVFDIENECWSQISKLPPRECLCSLIALGDSACFIGLGWEREELINQHDHNLESWFYPVFFYDEDKLFLQNRVSLDIFIYHINQKHLEPIEGHRHRCKNYSLYKPTLFLGHLQ
ncbi:hypothetical protein AMTRI_Chr09g40020 [Amborella trichopoda]